MRALAAALTLAFFVPLAHAAGSFGVAAPQNKGQLMRLAWQSLTMHFSFPQNSTEIVVRFERELNPLTGARLENIVISTGTQSYVVHDQSLQLIKLNDLGDMWTSLYVAADGTKYVSLYIPEIGGTMAEIDVLGMNHHRINMRRL